MEANTTHTSSPLGGEEAASSSGNHNTFSTDKLNPTEVTNTSPTIENPLAVTKKYVQIPQMMSAPTDPAAPSFLISLPPELRLMVYDVLYKHNGPIVLFDEKSIEEDDESPPRAEWDSEAEYFHEYRRSLHSAMPFLLSCRQIYHEAVRVLYSESEQVPWAGSWLHSICSHFNYLTKVVIDLESRCPLDCDWSGVDYLDAYPILRTMWAHPTAICEIKFAHARGLPTMHPDTAVEKKADIDCLNQIFTALAYKNPLQIKTIARFERLTEAIQLDNQGTGGYLRLKENPHGSDMGWIHAKSRQFHVYDNGQTFIWETENQDLKPKLDTLNSNVLRQIAAEIFRSESGITWDLDHPLSSTAIPYALLNTNKKLRFPALDSIYLNNRPVIRMRTSESRTSFTNFAVLKEWWLHQRPGATRYIYKKESSLDFELNFAMSGAWRLSDLRINITELLHVSCGEPHDYRLHFRLKNDVGGEHYEAEQRVPLGRLLAQTFLILSNVLQNDPRIVKHVCPEIWVDGRGTIVEVVCGSYQIYSNPESDHILNFEGENAEEELSERARSYALKKLEIHDWKPKSILFSGNAVLKNDLSLGDFWNLLRFQFLAW
jgi:hypothetical protein